MALDQFCSSGSLDDSTDVVIVKSPERDFTVAVVGMCHLGSVRYYQRVLDIAANSDVVLYERTSLRPRAEWGAADCFNFLQYAPDIVPRVAERMTALREKGFREACNGSKDIETKIAALRDDLTIVSQRQAIDYGNLPENWRRADAAYDQNFGWKDVFSRENLGFLRTLPLLYLVMKSDAAADMVARAFLKPVHHAHTDLEAKRASAPRVFEHREREVYREFHEAERDPTVHRLALLYGADHAGAFSRYLWSKGYEPQRRVSLTVMRKDVASMARPPMASLTPHLV